jgi:hypothetical protein
MSTLEFWGQVRECRRLLRLHRQIADEVEQPTAAWRLTRALFPWGVVPLLALASFLPSIGVAALGTLGMALLGYLGVFPPLRLTTFEALRMPSRRALYVARLHWSLPWLLWVGLWGAPALLHFRGGMNLDARQTALALLSVALVPWVVFGTYGAIIILLRKPWLALFGLIWIGSVFAIRFDPLARGGPALVEFVPLLFALVAAGLIALQVWGVGRLEPLRQMSLIRGDASQKLGGEEAATAPPPGTAAGLGRLGPVPLLAGRHGLGWAAFYYALVSLRRSPGKAVVPLVMGMAVVVLFISLVQGDQPFDSGAWWWLLYFCVYLGSPLHVSNPQRLYLLGVDYRRQLVHRLRTFWVTPGLLLVAVPTLAVVALGGKVEMPLTLLAVVAALTLFREGWWGWPSQMGRRHILMTGGLLLWLGFLVGAGRWAGLPGPGWDTATRAQLFALACAACGLVGIAFKWFWLDEARLLEVMRG